MGNVNMEAYQIHCGGKSLAEKLTELDAIAQQVGELPTFTSDDRAFLEAVPAFPAEDGEKFLKATTADGETELSYEAPEVKGSDIAPTFSESVTYSAGTLVYYDGILYKYTVDHAVGAWDPSEVTPTSAAAEFVETNAAVDELKNTLDEVKNNSWVVLNDNVKYRVSGGFVYISAKLSNTNGSWASLGTMPEGLRPSNSVYNCCLYAESPTASYANLYCDSQGSIQQFANAAFNNGFLLYPIEQ